MASSESFPGRVSAVSVPFVPPRRLLPAAMTIAASMAIVVAMIAAWVR